MNGMAIGGVGMRGVGYIIGDTLDSIQEQWGKLLETGVDVILFDRECLKTGGPSVNFDKFSEEQEAIWQYMENMRAGQSVSGNFDNYEVIEDLVPSDTIVLVDLDLLKFAAWDIWERIMKIQKEGIQVTILSEGFHSVGEYGDNMLNMMNQIYEFAKTKFQP
jgi:hypothetical protein